MTQKFFFCNLLRRNGNIFRNRLVRIPNTLFIEALNWKQSKCPVRFMDEEIVVYPYLEY